MPFHTPGRHPIRYSEIPHATDYEISHIFDGIFHNATQQIGDQLVTDNSTLRLFYRRPSNSINISETPEIAEAFKESLEIWSEVIDQNGRLSLSAQNIANRVSDPDTGKPSLEEYISSKYGFDEVFSLAITSRAMWDMLMIRGLPATDLAND